MAFDFALCFVCWKITSFFGLCPTFFICLSPPYLYWLFVFIIFAVLSATSVPHQHYAYGSSGAIYCFFEVYLLLTAIAVCFSGDCQII